MREWKRVAEGEPDERLRGVYAGLALVFAELAGRSREWELALEGWNVRRSQVMDRARADARREDVLQALELRFHAPVPEDLAEAIQALADLDELTRWFRASLTASSLEEFRAAVRR
jgi:hypothetical protein